MSDPHVDPPAAPEGAREGATAAPERPRRARVRAAGALGRAARDWLLPVLAAGLLVLAAAVALGPWLASRTVLPAALRAALGEGAQVGAVEASWRRGVVIRQLALPLRGEGGGPRGTAWLAEVRLEAPLGRTLWDALRGRRLRGALVVGPGRVRALLPDDAAEPAEPEPSDERGEEGGPLAGGADLSLELRGLELELALGGPSPTAAASAEAPPPDRIVAEGARGVARLALASDGAWRLAGVRLEANELRLLRPDPTATVSLHEPTLRAAELALPDRPLAAALGEAAADLRLAGHAETGGAALGPIELRAAARDGRAHAIVEAGGGANGATLRAVLTLDGRHAGRWPATLRLDAEGLPVRGLIGDVGPYLLPLLEATSAEGGRFPPLSLSLAGEGPLVWRDLETLDVEATLAALSGGGRAALAPGHIHGSLLLDGYARALLRLELGGLLDGLLPPDLAFGGGRGELELAQGEVRLPGWVLEGAGLALDLRGRVVLADGGFALRVAATGPNLPSDVQGILRALDEAGGLLLEGDLTVGEVRFGLPSPAALAEAARRLGVLEAFQTRTGPLFRRMRETLEGDGREGAPLERR